MKFAKNVLLLIFSCLLVLLLLEAGLGFLEKHRFIELNLEVVSHPDAQLNVMAHPYLGFVSLNSSYDEVNFFNKTLRYVPAKDEIVVGLFGGSVASNTALGTRTSKTFQDVLQSRSGKKSRS